jgi:hypothetical protein
MESIMGFVTDIIGDITGSNQAADAAQAAARTQAGAAQAGIGEQRRQFDQLVELMSPFVEAGTGALGQQQALLGLGGQDAQQQAVSALEQSPAFQAIAKQGEEAMLQQAAATGGLRGGNIQGALSQFRPQLLQSQIQQQLGQLGGLTQLGQASAAGQGAQGLQAGANIANLLGQAGSATAGGQLAAGQARQNAFGNLLQIGGAVGGLL